MIDIIQGDCLEEMKKMPSESIDFVFADPPYNIGLKYAGYRDSRNDYDEWVIGWVTECFRLLKPTGSIAVKTITRNLPGLFLAMEKNSNVFINQVAWRNVSANHNQRGFWMSYEPILVYGKTDQYKFNSTAEYRKPMQRWSAHSTPPKGSLLDYWDDIPFVYAGSIKHREAILVDGTNKKAHPCQMPINLPGRFIAFLTDENDNVLDPFLGSGTTCVASWRLKRNCIGIEIDPVYCEMSRSRLSSEMKQPPLLT